MTLIKYDKVKLRTKAMVEKIFFLFLVLFFLPVSTLFARNFLELELETRLEEELRSKITTYLGTENVIVNIRFTVGREEIENLSDDEGRSLLPGIPTERTIDRGETTYQTFIEDMAISLFIGKELTDAEENGIINLIEELFPFDMNLGENLIINQFTPSEAPQEINLVAIAIGALSLVLIVIFFGPFKSVFSSINETISDLSAAAESNASSSTGGGSAVAPAGGGVTSTAAAQAPSIAGGGGGRTEDEHRPFSFIKENDIPALQHVLEKKPAAATATVLYSLPGELSGKLFSSLSPMMRKKVLSISRKVREPRDDISDLEEEIKFKVNYSYGGAEKLSEIVQNTNLSTREEIFKFLGTKDKKLLDKVKSKIFQFEDLVYYSDKDFNNIARKVGVKRIANIINNIPNKTGRKLMEKLTPQLKALAVEHSKASPELNPKKLERERVQLQDMLFQLGEQGTVTPLEEIKEGKEE